MRLLKLKTNGFRALVNIEVDFDALTILIGENDAGKSSILDLLDIFLGGGRPDENDFYLRENGTSINKLHIIVEFELEEDDGEARSYAVEDKLKVKKVYTTDGIATTFYWAEVPDDSRLVQNFDKMSVPSQKDLITDLDSSVDLSKLSNSSKRSEWLTKYAENSPRNLKWVEAPSRWGNFLPRFERYSSMDYNAPENMIAKTLKRVYEQSIFEEEEREDGTVTRKLIKPLRQVKTKATEQILQEVADLKDGIRKYNKRVRSIGYEPVFDFINSLRIGEFQVDFGYGLHSLSKTGDGTKRRMFMAILDWDREISLEQAKTGTALPSIIRGYDEPDTNLHYEAQRSMYQTITDIVNAENSRIQAVLCTHSLTMIDRAPAQNIRMLTLDQNGHAQISQLNIDDDPEIEYFLLDLARELGITNSLIFYERCFILIEGETEENALPIFYKKLYGRRLFEDGIRVINVKGNGATKEFLKLFSRNRQELIVVFVDEDTKATKPAKLTAKVLKESGFSNDFISERLIYAGNEEFEDMFADEVIANCLQNGWPKVGGIWECNEISNIRGKGKFSKKIKGLVWDATSEEGDHWSKPEFGRQLADHCAVENIPQVVRDLFECARTIAGI